ncbi:MAG: two-component system response regulator [Chthoniobacterales bacterium]
MQSEQTEGAGAPACDPNLQKPRRVLYIEDNSPNMALVEQIFAEQTSLELMTATEGQIGLDLARQHAPDLILLDLHLPDIPGWEVIEQLKADHTTREVPVIVVSADATVPQIKRLLSAGAHSYLTKPFDIAEFFRSIDEALAAPETAKAG